MKTPYNVNSDLFDYRKSKIPKSNKKEVIHRNNTFSESANYNISRDEVININYIPQLLERPVSDESFRETLFHRVFNQVRKDINIIINGKKFTNNIVLFDGENLPEESDTRIIDGKTYIVLPEGIDGVIVNIDKNFNSSIVLPVADCAAINLVNKDIGIYGTLHAGYKGTAKGIIDELFKMFEDDPTFIKGTKFDISPMAGNDFELPKKYYDEIFGNYLRSKGLDPHSPRYYLEVPHRKSKLSSGEEKTTKMCNFSLKYIILDILELHGVPMENIKFSPYDTTDLTNDFYSYRLHSNYKAMQNSFIENFELSAEEFTPASDNSNYLHKILKYPHPKLNINGRMASITQTQKKD